MPIMSSLSLILYGFSEQLVNESCNFLKLSTIFSCFKICSENALACSTLLQCAAAFTNLSSLQVAIIIFILNKARQVLDMISCLNCNYINILDIS